ncbi:hypothetical protein [Sediminitomix flava]|uniref:Lipoprotein n=1 Tax=Sediminitomix flava TaxID=379075 RepID=A0A315ZEU3_SEDFL|nr:hypothetical protein [Sediminitomix flava]PWJ43244.1 hypothetical protein BC781_102793 [Sediminitomix flava]
MVKVFYTTLIFFIFISCDTPGRLIIKNNLKNPIHYKSELVIDQGSAKTKVHLDTISTSDERIILFGFGFKWNSDYCQRYYTDRCKYLEFSTLEDTVRFDSPEEILTLFEQNKRGLRNKTVKIKLKKLFEE